MAISDIIARLGVSLSLDTASFTTGSRKAQAEAASLQSKMASVGKTIAGAFIVAGGIEWAKGLISQGLEYASSLGEVAQQLGVTTAELQEYRYIASQVGIDQEQMDKGLAKLSITLGQLASGAEPARKSFEKFGLTAQEIDRISRMSAGEAFPLLADAYNRLESPTKKAAAAAEVFKGKLGPAMQTALAQGASGINGLRNAANDLGIVISEELIDRADRAQDKLTELKTVLSARIAGAVAENADAIYKLADAFTTLAMAAVNAGAAVANFVQKSRAENQWRERAKDIWDQQHGFGKSSGSIFNVRSTKGLDQAARTKAHNAIDAEISRRMGFGGTSGGLFNARSSNGPRKGDKLPAALMPAAAPAAEAVRQITDAHSSLGSSAEKAAKRVRGANKDIEDSSKKAAQELASLRDRLFPEERKSQEFDADLKRLGTMFPDGAARDDAVHKLWNVFGHGSPGDTNLSEPDFGDTDIVGDGVKRALDALDRFGDKAESTKVRVAKTFKDMADDTIGSFERLSGAIKGGGFLDILGAVVGVGLQLGSTGLFGKSIATRLNAEPRAKGGAIAAGRPYLVGERGPELVVPGHSGRVISNDNLGGRGSVYHIQGNLLTPEFWAQIQQGDMAAASAGAQGGVSLLAYRGSRKLA